MLYFDHNAAAPLHPVARDAWLAASEQFIGNPSSLHRVGGRADAALTETRHRLARLLGCAAPDLVFTSGATESANLVLHHHAATLPTDAEIWLSGLEHPCVADTARKLFRHRQRFIPVRPDGTADLSWLERALTERRPGLVALMAANNVTGILQPWRETLALCRRHQVPFFCDAVQWLGRESAAGLGDCDWLSGCAHKVGGPRGIGFLKVPGQAPLAPQILGGPQEDARRAGTENVAGALALVALLEHRERQTADLAERRAWRENFARRLVERLPGTEILGIVGGDSRAANRPGSVQPAPALSNDGSGVGSGASSSSTLWNTVAAIMPETDCPNRWLVKLDKLGCAVSMGSACASGKEEPSPALLAMGLPPEKASRLLRFSAGWETTAGDWDRLLECVLAAAKELGLGED